VVFSRIAVVAPFDGVPSLMFRMANARGTQIVEARLKLVMLRDEVTSDGDPVRRLHDLRLRRSEHAAFALTWTAIHPIDEHSPLYGLSSKDLGDGITDLIASLSGIDEGLAQPIHARYAYRAEDIRWNARFADILTQGPERSVIDYTRFHDAVPLGDGASRRAAPRTGAATPS
jgi:inward rectifier potassium channel